MHMNIGDRNLTGFNWRHRSHRADVIIAGHAPCTHQPVAALSGSRTRP